MSANSFKKMCVNQGSTLSVLHRFRGQEAQVLYLETAILDRYYDSDEDPPYDIGGFINENECDTLEGGVDLSTCSNDSSFIVHCNEPLLFEENGGVYFQKEEDEKKWKVKDIQTYRLIKHLSE